ncbi:MAG: hypothetical protein Q8P59_12925 [Dehalococcoidia bacterium]|nr:hypothetical protein [Dehalococcoidia bacterium]
MQVPDVVLWVGSKFYPTAEDFIKEALTLGCSKRVPSLPTEIIPGQSRAFLAHDNGHKGHGFIFGFFVISGVEAILDDQGKIDQYQKDFANLAQAAVEPPRLCGHRPVGATYLVSHTNDMEKVYQAAEPLADKAEVKGDLVILLHPIAYPRLRFRGWRYMEPQFLEKYDWPQQILPVKHTVRIEHDPNHKPKLPLLEGLTMKGSV